MVFLHFQKVRTNSFLIVWIPGQWEAFVWFMNARKYGPAEEAFIWFMNAREDGPARFGIKSFSLSFREYYQ